MRRPRARLKYRRSPTLVLQWINSEFVCTDAASGKRYVVAPEAVFVLHCLDGRTEAADIATAHPELGDTAAIGAVIDSLASCQLITTTNPPAWRWASWPEAALFHFSTRALRFPNDPLEHDRQLRAKAAESPAPSPVKKTPGHRVDLPAPGEIAELGRTLTNRRTWRNFSKRKLELSDLSTILQSTFGVQRWGIVKGQGRIVLKTSPSAGARHPIEAYVLAANVRGLAAGVYHYDAAGHHLVDLKRAMSKSILRDVLANQHYFADASAVVVMSAVFSRSMWKYSSSRAYRAILIDAGHLGQTFCLVATAMGLAPFSTMAFREEQIDPLLRIDGVNESAVYIVGVGTRAVDHANRPGRIN